VQLSRMRYENPGIPREVPFLCWDQDNLPCMRTEAATASLTDRQTGALTYVAGHGAIFGFGHLDWPEGNCIFCHAAGATHRYAAEPVAADLLEKYTCDISYVSNASDGPGVLAGELRGHWDKHEALLGVFEECAREIFAASEAGRCWDDVSLGKLLLPRAQAVGLEQGSAVYHEMAMDLHRYADRCLRHVTLGWVSRWCAAHGKTLRLYGKGWERHAELGQWAAGLAGQGEELRAIYQASRINLQIIESGFIHARSLDGLAAGGFFLTRHVPADGEDVGLLRDVYLLGRWVVEKGITSPAEIEASGDAEVMGRWKRTLAYHTWTPEHAVRVLKVWAKTPAPAVAFPMLPEISFQDEAGFGRLAEAFLGDEGRRREMAGRMRQIVLHEFSYDSRWKEFLAHVVRGLKVAAGAPSRSQEF